MKTIVKEYIAAITQLVGSLCIKSSINAITLNAYLVNTHGESAVDPTDKYSWKYYLNVSGEYHPTDTPMNVISLDTMEAIDFSKEALELNPETKAAYAYGTEYYNELVARYPEQKMLIMGILYPCDIDYAIESKDGTILSYDTSFIEVQEDTLKYDIQAFLYNAMQQRDVRAFYLIDELYPACQLATQIVLPLETEIFTLRQKRCFTNEAHSFHIRQHLASHLKLDDYFKFFTLKQKLFLYRNAQWLEKNIGKQEVFELVISKLLTERGIPISEYSIRHQDKFTEDLYPEMLARRKALNPKVNVSYTEFISLRALFDKIRSVTYGNADYLAIHEDSILENFATASSAVTQTKVLESSMIDYSDSIPDPILMVLFRQLIYFAYHGLYTPQIKFKDTNTSEDRNLTPKECVIYLVYLLVNSNGYPIEAVPDIINRRYRRPVLPTQSHLEAGIPANYEGMKVAAANVLAGQPSLKLCFSPTQFFKLNNKIFQESYRHWLWCGRLGDAFERAILEGFTNQLYADELVNLSEQEDPVLYVDWLAARELPTYNYTTEQANRLILKVFESATGYVFDETKDLASIQTAMINTLKKFCSYTVMFLKEINASRIRPAGFPAARPFDTEMFSSGETYAISGLTTNDISMSQSTSVSLIGEDSCNVTIAATMEPNPMEAYEEISEWNVGALYPTYRATINYFVDVINVEYSGQDPNARFLGDETLSILTDEQRELLFSIYQ